MAKVRIRNISPQGALVVPVLGGRVVEAGEVIEVPSDLGPGLLEQADVWQSADAKTTKSDGGDR